MKYYILIFSLFFIISCEEMDEDPIPSPVPSPVSSPTPVPNPTPQPVPNPTPIPPPSCEPINGGWGNFGTCIGVCNTIGTQTRNCNNPVPSCGGINCVGPNSRNCNTPSCPVPPPPSNTCTQPSDTVNCWGINLKIRHFSTTLEATNYVATLNKCDYVEYTQLTGVVTVQSWTRYCQPK